jgi:DNA-directed RNA polymerase subunit RPC12/RpoP
MPIKKCPKCGEEKEYSLFYANKQSKINCSPYCKVCSNLRTTSYARTNRDKIQPKLGGYALKRRYGIGIEDYERMLISQNYKCAICGTPNDPNGRNFAVDHCHNTKKVRGLLCSRCNTGLGQLDDSVERLKQALDYLEKYA